MIHTLINIGAIICVDLITSSGDFTIVFKGGQASPDDFKPGL